MTSSLPQLLAFFSLLYTVTQNPCHSLSQNQHILFTLKPNTIHANGLALGNINRTLLISASSPVNRTSLISVSSPVNRTSLISVSSPVNRTLLISVSSPVNRTSLISASSPINRTSLVSASSTVNALNAIEMTLNTTDVSIAATTQQPIAHGFLLGAVAMDKAPEFVHPGQESVPSEHSALISRCKLLCTSGLPCPPECLAHPNIWSDTIGKRSDQHIGIVSLLKNFSDDTYTTRRTDTFI
ncbi:uncharacterized protein LOC127859384 [Dreissena polymorpha]|nr:uncharacterized protein LOC127859384 [Dreissena polymorpha]XP_052252698.1 uncharacterized protein LOC127859384 [Dreissena polymorpha]XP_052252699.1 uncharacterized protein LOC127859384 [Dreissena polymorpha]